MMKKLFIALLVAVFLFSACSSKEEKSEKSLQEANSQETEHNTVQETAEQAVEEEYEEVSPNMFLGKNGLAFFLENLCGEYTYYKKIKKPFIGYDYEYDDIRIELIENSRFCVPEIKDFYRGGFNFNMETAANVLKGKEAEFDCGYGKMATTEYSFYFLCDKLVFKIHTYGIHNFNPETGDGEEYEELSEIFFTKKIGYNYNNKNGTIIECNLPNMNADYDYTLRVHNQSVGIPNNSHSKDLSLYEEPSIKSEKIGVISDRVDVQKFLKIQNKKNPREIQIWLLVQCNGKGGYVNVFNSNSNGFDKNAFVLNPYLGDKWAYIEIIVSDDKEWTVRKMTQTITLQENLNVRDKPGVGSVKTGFLEKTGDLENDTYIVVAATEEKEDVDGISDRWLKVQFGEDKEGWIFGGYVSTESQPLGAKYHAADDIVEHYLK